MSWNQIQTLFDGQGLLFWAAVVAVTLGLTMLSVSIVFQLRKVVGRRAWPRWRRSGAKQVRPKAAAAPQAVATADGYRVRGLVSRPATTEPVDPLLGSLLARLKDSADRLERMHSSLDATTSSRFTADSTLKDPSPEVDYVYQASRA